MIPGLGRSPGERNVIPLQYSYWRIPWTGEPGRSQTRLSHFHFFILPFISVNKNNYFQTKSISIKVPTLLGRRQDIDFFFFFKLQTISSEWKLNLKKFRYCMFICSLPCSSCLHKFVWLIMKKKNEQI